MLLYSSCCRHGNVQQQPRVASTHMELLPAAADCRDGCASLCNFTSVGTLKGECWPVSQESRKRHIKPGESREAKQHKVFIDEEGRQRHVMSLDDKLVGVVRAWGSWSRVMCLRAGGPIASKIASCSPDGAAKCRCCMTGAAIIVRRCDQR